MIANIIDGRLENLRWQQVWAVAEPTCRDNALEDADEAPADACFGPLSVGPASITDILAWASRLEGHVTLFLYDEDPLTGAMPLHRAQPTAEEMRLLAAETIRIADELELHARSLRHPTTCTVQSQQPGET